MKLRGRIEAPALGAEGAQFLSARGAKRKAHHGPLQRLLGGEPPSSDTRESCALLNRMSSSEMQKATNPAAKTHPTAAAPSPLKGFVAPTEIPPMVQPNTQAAKKPVDPAGILAVTWNVAESSVAVPRIGNGV